MNNSRSKTNVAPIGNVPSPCISLCVLNEDDICTGCYRTAGQIRTWGSMTNSEKMITVKESHQREKLVNPFL